MGSDSAIVKRLTEELFIKGNASVLDELVADNFVSHDPPPGIAPTKEGFRQLSEMVIAAFADRSMEFDDYTETADGRVVESWAMLGTHTGEAFGLPPSGQPVRVRGVELFRCKDGQITEHWGAVDMGDVLGKALAGQG